MFPMELADNNPIEALFFSGYNDPGAGPTAVAAFEVRLLRARACARSCVCVDVCS